MTRALRIQYEGAWYHVMNRGLESRDIFLNDKHRKLFLHLLSEILERFQVDIHSYCLMDNHYHLLLQTQLPNLNLVMKHLSGIYTVRFNRDIKRDGPLFRGRYKSILIDKDSYLLNVSRYIHKNPSTAKLTDNDQKYTWSSYQYYNINKHKKPKWLVINEVLNYFNGDSKNYVTFVEKGSDENINKFYSSQKLKSILGSKFFIKEISNKFFKKIPGKHLSNRDQIITARFPSLKEMLLLIINKYGVSPDIVLENKARNYVFERSLLIYLFMFNPRYSLVEKGRFLGISDDAISNNYKRFLRKLELDNELKKEVEKVREDMYD